MSTTEATRVYVYDTTLRDGTQGEGVSLSLEDKLLIAEALDRLGVDYVEGGYPMSNPKDEAFFAEVARRDIARSKIAAFGMTRRRGVKADQDAGLRALLDSHAPVTTVVGKTWDLHVREVLRASEQENLDMVHESLALLAGEGREVVFDAEHFFDGYLANPDYALSVLRAAAQAGATTLVLCDTNGGSTLAQVAHAVRRASKEFPGVRIGIHCHNDCALAVANTLMAVRHGALHVQGTINGIGERCGNADLTAVIPNLAVKYGYQCLGEDSLKRLTETSRYVYEIANLNLHETQPFVGSAAFAHKGGMHVHAIQRNAVTYEHMDPERIGNARRILVSELSGVSNIAAKAPAKFGLKDDRAAQKRILDELTRLESEGYQFEAAEASFEMLIRRVLDGQWYPTIAGGRRGLWDLDHYRCIILKQSDSQAVTEATVKLTLGGTVEHRVAEGDGPVDSLHRSLKAVLRTHYPCVDDLHLADYKVRVVNTAAETAARVRVLIDWHDAARGQSYFGSVGVSTNIIDASWLALVDAMEYEILNSQAAGE